MAHIGFATGAMHMSYFPLEAKLKLFKESGCNSVELTFGEAKTLNEFHFSDAIKEALKEFEIVTIHAPWREIRYNSESIPYINKLKDICSEQKIYGIVVHPNTVDDYKVLEKSGLPFLIENMDDKARCGTHPGEFEKLKKDYNFGFVLDLQHAYMHDPTMQLAGELIEAMGDRIKESHVSGQKDGRPHSLLHHSDNSNMIIGMLRSDIPIILEGNDGLMNEIRDEVDLIRKVLSV